MVLAVVLLASAPVPFTHDHGDSGDHGPCPICLAASQAGIATVPAAPLVAAPAADGERAPLAFPPTPDSPLRTSFRSRAPPA